MAAILFFRFSIFAAFTALRFCSAVRRGGDDEDFGAERPDDDRPEPEERPPEELPPDERPPDERPPDERPPDERPVEERPPEGRRPGAGLEELPPELRPSGVRVTDRGTGGGGFTAQ